MKVNKSLKYLNLKLNRIDDKGGSKLCIDLLNNNSNLEFISLSSNSLGHMFCESLAEFLKINRTIRRVDISCNFIDDSNANTLKDSLESNSNIIEIDVRNNQLSEETEREVNEIVTKNMLLNKNIPYKRLGDCKLYIYIKVFNGFSYSLVQSSRDNHEWSRIIDILESSCRIKEKCSRIS